MLFRRTISKMFAEEKPVEEKYAHLRVVRPQEELQKVEVADEQTQETPVVLSDTEIARNWIMSTLKTREATFKSEKCLFGTISFSVPVKECNPELVKEIMLTNHIPLLGERPQYNLRTRELQEVRFTFDTPVDGIIYLF